MSSMPQILIDAQNNWPEDEASLTVQSYNGRLGDANDCVWAKECAQRDVKHMHKVFSREFDAVALTARYNAELIRLGMPANLLP